MEIYNVGTDSIDEYDTGHLRDGYAWVVANYAYGNYEGGGLAAAFDPATGKIDVYDCGHCSCYGPLGDVNTPVSLTIDEFFAPPTTIHADDYSPLWSKVAELLGRPAPEVPSV